MLNHEVSDDYHEVHDDEEILDLKDKLFIFFTDMASFISLSQITKTYESKDIEPVQVLKWIDLEIERGNFIAIMGPSGCGKSTLMNIVWLLDTPTTGNYYIDGQQVESLDEDAQAMIRRDTIGFVFQWYNLLKRMRSRQQVALPLSYMGISTGERYKRAVEALELVGLWDKIDSMPNQLSGWQQQRVCIARSLVTNAGLILADEPTGALDSKTGAEVMELFKRLNEEQGKTILLITHDANVAKFATKIVRMMDGVFLS